MPSPIRAPVLPPPLTVDAVLAELAAGGVEARRRYYAHSGSRSEAYGTPMSVVRPLARRILAVEDAPRASLAAALWETRIIDAQLLAAMIAEPAALSVPRAREMIESTDFTGAADEFAYGILARAPIARELRQRWLDESSDALRRVAWCLVVADIMGGGLTATVLGGYLDRIAAELAAAPPKPQEPMNRALVEVAVRYPELTGRCVALGEQLGVYRDLTVPKGCTSAYAPAWIAALLARKAAR
jgi:3-methyladenine DNA glycosylase AlkD